MARNGKHRPAGLATLSARERLVLIELARGLQTEEIAEALHLSPHTVRTHVKNSMRKLRSKTRAQAVAHACLGGLVKSAR
jgi:DNA-binding CsgD family transcriptional regulator